jgi:uncharacterized protein with von Willebrand factor type A (vWA) domain
VWKNNLRRTSERTSTRTCCTSTADYKVIFVGDAAMAPYEITQAGGSVEHWNEEPATCGCSASWRSTRSYLDQPVSEGHLGLHRLDQHRAGLDRGQMYPLTLRGLEEGMRFLSK